jgi:hypothetical protein
MQIFMCSMHGVSYCILSVKCWVWILVFIVDNFGWTWCTIQGIFLLCFICAVTMIIISINIEAHDNYKHDKWAMIYDD